MGWSPDLVELGHLSEHVRMFLVPQRRQVDFEVVTYDPVLQHPLIVPWRVGRNGRHTANRWIPRQLFSPASDQVWSLTQFYSAGFLLSRITLEQLCVLQAHNQGLRRLSFTASRDLHAECDTSDGVLVFLKFWKQCISTTLQSLTNTKLSPHSFWPCHENGLIKTIPTIPHNL